MKLFLTTFNWHGELHEFYSQAKDANRAVSNSVARLAKKLGISKFYVKAHLRDRDKVLVKEILNAQSSVVDPLNNNRA